jgi:hypothetical protein
MEDVAEEKLQRTRGELPQHHRHGGVIASREWRWAEGGIRGRGFTVQ